MVGAIGSTFQVGNTAYEHPTKPNLKAINIYNLLPAKMPSDTIQCNFDSTILSDTSKRAFILQENVEKGERLFELFASTLKVILLILFRFYCSTFIACRQESTNSPMTTIAKATWKRELPWLFLCQRPMKALPITVELTKR